MGTINLDIFVNDIDGVIAAYDSIKVRRSTTGETGPYADMTAPSPQSAALPAYDPPPFDVVGKTLRVAIDNDPYEVIVFTGGLDPLSSAAVVAQINDILPGVAVLNGTGFYLVSPLTGSNSKIEVDGGAAEEFGWGSGTRDIGEEAYIPLVSGQTLYNFVDKDGEATHYYQAAFYNTTDGLQSAWSSAFQGSTGTVVDASNLSTATVDLATVTGVAASGQRIIIYPYHDPLLVASGYNIALDDEPITITTDNTGHAEISLIKGSKVRVVFEGTSLIREIVVPDTDTFDLLTLMATANDPYAATDPEVPFAIRRTL